MEAVRVLRPPMPRSSRSGTLSIIQGSAIDDTRMGSAALRMLVTLGAYADGKGWCWPKQKTLAARLGMSQQAVSKALRQLSALGYIEIHEQYDRDTGARLSSRYQVILDFQLPLEFRRTPQPDVVGGQLEVVTPATSEVVTPATSEVVAKERPIRTTHKERPKKNVARSVERAPKEKTAQALVIDAIAAGGGAVAFGARDGKAVKECGADAQLIADAYLAAWRGEWGDGWLRENLSVRLVVERLGGYQAWLADQRPASRPQPAPIKVAPATHRDIELWTAALADLRTMNNAANYETYLEPLEVAGRGADGGLRLICNPLMVDGLRRFKNQIASALASAGDEAPSSVGFAARRRALENNTDGD